MSNYSFDRIIDRRNTNSSKWDTLAGKYNRKDLIHLGVADMDFMSPKPILNALQRVVDHGVFGYSDLNPDFYSSIQKWMKAKLEKDIPSEWIVFCPRINIAAGICVNSFSRPGSNIIINSPSYSPLRNAITKNGRVSIDNPLVLIDDRFQMDFASMEGLADANTEMFFLVNPDNPSGRVWSEYELEQLADYCLRHNLILFSDEIHSDILAPGVKHHSVLSLTGDITKQIIYAGSLTKTFNIPGIIVSYMIIPNHHLRTRVIEAIDAIGMHNPNIFSAVAVQAGYNHCKDWVEEASEYINQNEIFFRTYIERYMPEFHIHPREGTYLLWIDYTAFAISEDKLLDWFINQAGVEVYMGTNFGKEGLGYIRINLATSRQLLLQALEQMRSAYPQIQPQPCSYKSL